jgi:hypothetical protein
MEAEKVSHFDSTIDASKSFHSEALWNEFKILDRLMYKYHNQQRRNVHFRRLKLLRRRLQRISRMERWVTWAVVEGNEADMARKTLGVELIGELVEAARRDCMEAYGALHALLLDVIYVPFALVSSACVAKMFVQLGKLGGITRALRLDLHSQPDDMPRPSLDLHAVTDEEGGRKETKGGKRRILHEKRESGWEHATGEGKKRKFVKKLKRPFGRDEIDDIFH